LQYAIVLPASYSNTGELNRRNQMTYDVWDRLWMVLATNDAESVVYVYRLNSYGKPIKPCLLKTRVWMELPDMLRDQHGGGHFKLLIRKGRTMIFSGEIAIASDPFVKN
jgi:hypothetical protein